MAPAHAPYLRDCATRRFMLLPRPYLPLKPIDILLEPVNAGDGQIFDAGEIVEAEPPRRLVIRWQHQNKPELKAEGDSLCTMELEPCGSAVKLSITHTIEREP